MKTILGTVDGHKIKIVQTYYDQGYIFPSFEYSLYVKGKLVKRKVSSIKSAYCIAYKYLKNKGLVK